ncbi:Reverse transcriptase RNA-dependent DNA polymerase [Trinorchestia longiramus]|nr:Reverse transcriptase RNA-dependent DNA polymerase [Trinorchestia longiramus]
MERGLTGLTGYGPSNLTFDGNDERYGLWEVKFRAYLDLKSLNSVLEGEESSLDVEKNKQVFSKPVQRLDDKSLSLIIRDAYGDGRKSMKILGDHYLGSSKPRIISLHCKLAALKMQNGENVTDYLLRAETTASYLKRAGEMISDGLIIAMIIRGLPAAYNAFSTVITQRDSAEMDFQKFKSALKSEEETKKTRQSHSENKERVMKVKDSKIIYYLCGATQHMCNNKSQFSPYSDLSSPVRIEIGDGRALKGVGVGYVRLKITLPHMQKEPSKEMECVPCSFPQHEKHEDSEGELELRRSTRNRAAPDRCGEWMWFAQDKFDVPANVEEALHGPESKLLKAAMEEEMASMNINNVWSFVECPKNKKPIRCKCIFKKKTGPDGNVCSYKAWLVAQGLNKSLYGLKQSPKCWNTALNGHLKQLGFKQSKNDIHDDIFIKGLSAEKFSRLRKKLGVVFFEKHIQCEK